MGNIEHWDCPACAGTGRAELSISGQPSEFPCCIACDGAGKREVVDAANYYEGAVEVERERIAELIRRRGVKAGGDAKLLELADRIAAGGQ